MGRASGAGGAGAATFILIVRAACASWACFDFDQRDQRRNVEDFIVFTPQPFDQPLVVLKLGKLPPELFGVSHFSKQHILQI